MFKITLQEGIHKGEFDNGRCQSTAKTATENGLSADWTREGSSQVG